MNWTSSKNKLPDDGEQVLTYINNGFKIAVFQRSNGGFELHDGNFLWIEKQEVMWAPLIVPDHVTS
jgi:hypothetical protein